MSGGRPRPTKDGPYLFSPEGPLGPLRLEGIIRRTKKGTEPKIEVQVITQNGRNNAGKTGLVELAMWRNGKEAYFHVLLCHYENRKKKKKEKQDERTSGVWLLEQ